MATNSPANMASTNHAEPQRQPVVGDLPPPATHAAASTPAAKKVKNKKPNEPVNPGQAVMDKIKQLELSKADEKEQEQEIEREVKKANREMKNMLSTLPTENARVDALQKKCNEYLANWKRAERELQTSKKKADQLQKDRDQAKTQLGKITGERDTFANTTRQMQKENKKLKVCLAEYQ
jgi:chromosome segregation ATPase